MKIELEVSELTEWTDSPWWMIIDPRQNMRTDEAACYNIAGMITGPFFSRKEAQSHLDARRYDFGPNAIVYCASAYRSGQYHDAYKQAKREQK